MHVARDPRRGAADPVGRRRAGEGLAVARPAAAPLSWMGPLLVPDLGALSAARPRSCAMDGGRPPGRLRAALNAPQTLGRVLRLGPGAPGEQLSLALGDAAEVPAPAPGATTSRSSPPHAPAPPPDPLASRPPPARRRLSYSSLTRYAACPYRFHLERHLGMPRARAAAAPRARRRAPADGLDPRVRGSLVHELLERLDARRRPRRRADAVRALGAAFEVELTREDVADLLGMVAAFAASELSARLGAAPRRAPRALVRLPADGRRAARERRRRRARRGGRRHRAGRRLQVRPRRRRRPRGAGRGVLRRPAPDLRPRVPAGGRAAPSRSSTSSSSARPSRSSHRYGPDDAAALERDLLRARGRPARRRVSRRGRPAPRRCAPPARAAPACSFAPAGPHGPARREARGRPLVRLSVSAHASCPSIWRPVSGECGQRNGGGPSAGRSREHHPRQGTSKGAAMTSIVSHQTVRLRRGKHASPEKGVCVMELASMLAGEPFSDRPQAVCPVIGAYLRSYNDVVDDERRQDLYRYAVRGDRVGRSGRAPPPSGRALPGRDRAPARPALARAPVAERAAGAVAARLVDRARARRHAPGPGAAALRPGGARTRAGARRRAHRDGLGHRARRLPPRADWRQPTPV